MILPTKGVPPSKALITVGGDILGILGQSSMSLGGVWAELREFRERSPFTQVSFDWFVLAADLLFTMGTIELDQSGLLRAVRS
jgi:hypothetical protein